MFGLLEASFTICLQSFSFIHCGASVEQLSCPYTCLDTCCITSFAYSHTHHTHTYTHTHIYITVCVCVSVISLANPCPAWWWWPCQRWLFTNCIFTSYFIAAAATCRKEQVREYYTENDCRSRQPLKYAKCVGGCGNQCCAAKIVRRRKVSN